MTSPSPSGRAAGPDHATAVEEIRHLIDVSRFEEARSRAAALLATHPDDIAALCLLAIALLGVDEHVSALQAAQRAIAVAPDEEWGYRVASLAHEALGQPRFARDAAQRATALAPHLWNTWVRLAESARVLPGHEHEAYFAVSEALRLAPNVATPHVVYGILAMRRDPGNARAAFENALRLDPGNSAAQNNLAVLDMRTNKLRRAGEGLMRAAASDPRDTVAQHNLRVTVHAIVARTCLAVFIFTLVLARPMLGEGTGRVPLPLTIIWCAGEAVALGLLAWWLSRVSARLRRHLWYLINKDAFLRVLVACLAAVLVLGTVGVAAPGPVGLVTRIAALLVVIAARILTAVSARRIRRAARN